jgi:hypothetical protein
MLQRRPDPSIVGAVLLGVLGVLYLAEGFYRALFGPLPQDLARRWLENAYFVRRISSFDVFDGTVPVAPDIGTAHPGGYPPWSLPVALLVAPPVDQDVLQVYFALLNALALVSIAWFVRRLAAPHGRAAIALLVASVSAISANAVVLRNGQYGLIVNAFLTSVLASLVLARPGQAGFFLALSALKPQSSGPFALLLFAKGRRVGVATAAATLLVCAFAAALWLERSPLRLLSQVFGQASHWEGGDAGVLRLCLVLGFPREVAIPVLAAGSMLAGAVLAYVHRSRSLLVQAAIACVVARLWTYHRRYDDLLLMFLLLPLALAALERRAKGLWAAYVAVGLTLWLPLREVDHTPALIALKVGIWVAGLAALLSSRFGRPASESSA